jgi:hypothetical protein
MLEPAMYRAIDPDQYQRCLTVQTNCHHGGDVMIGSEPDDAVILNEDVGAARPRQQAFDSKEATAGL